MGDLTIKEVTEDPKVRFQVELEFVQCLANPNYLNFLAQNEYLKQPEMINYLAYLQYWKEPVYSKYIKYPYCLYMLDQLQNPDFRRELANSHFCKSVEDQMLLHWSSYLHRRNKIMQNHAQSVPLMKENTSESAENGESMNFQIMNNFNDASN